jgi:hypothetical protein
MVVFLAYTIYCVVYRASNESDFAYLGDYTTFVNTEDNLSPDYEKNDLIIVRRENYYSMSQVVVYKLNASYRLGKIVKTTTSKYYIADSMNTDLDQLQEFKYDDIVGSVYTRIAGVGAIFKFLTSVASLIITAVLFLLYVAFAKEK